MIFENKKNKKNPRKPDNFDWLVKIRADERKESKSESGNDISMEDSFFHSRLEISENIFSAIIFWLQQSELSKYSQIIFLILILFSK